MFIRTGWWFDQHDHGLHHQPETSSSLDPAFVFELKDDFTAPNGVPTAWLDDRWIVRSLRRLAAMTWPSVKIRRLMLRLVIWYCTSLMI